MEDHIFEDATNFREVSVYPSTSEILGERKYVVRENITQGKFTSVEQYLDIHFHLLREDFLAPLRESIENYRSKQSTNFQVYKNVQISSIFLECKIKHSSFDKSLNEENCKKLMVGSLLIFTENDFEDISFLGKVARGRGCDLLNNELAIILVNCNERLLSDRRSFTMVESNVFFEPYFQVMSVLKSISNENFPMERYIIQVDASKKADLPKYLISSNFQIPNYICFEEKRNLLNDAQVEAFCAALSQEFVVIQGPPGTGKTFLGSSIAEIFIKNRHIWYRNSPMLVISHKNHALDQFVKSIALITDKLVRVGGQSQCIELEKYNLLHLQREEKKNLSKSARMRVDNLSIMKKALVVAMTTTSAARMRTTLEQLQCPIVIVEEAAEVLESHVVAALTKHCQHLILLGDHQQLKPNTSDNTVGNRYGLGVSLFERMINNGIQCYKLQVQHRMRPEISRLLKPTFYPFLKDDDSVKNRPPIYGVDKNVFFINHRMPEDDTTGTSKKNSHEASFLVAFAEYLISNGHDPSSIAILTTYSGQVEELESMMKLKRLSNKVTVSTLDAFQGQEADIVLLSLVRSLNIGFLATENRICVALSRARNGLYIMGNMNLLVRHSKVWATVNDCLTQTENIGPQLVLRCHNHPETTTNVEFAEDFKKVCGECYRKCNHRLPRGQKCRHVVDEDHEEYLCEESCERSVTCDQNHHYICQKKCWEECECDECDQVNKLSRNINAL